MGEVLKREIVSSLKGEGAHVSFDEAIAGIDEKYYGAEVKGLPYTLWRELQHMQLSLRDILDYIRDPNYQEKEWPEGYWPKQKAPPNKEAWTKCVKAFRADVKELIKLVTDPKTDLLKPIPHVKNGPALLHECLLVIDHNAYHIGQIILIRGWLGIWED